MNALLSDDGLPKGRPFHHHHQTRTRYPPSQFQALLCYARLLEAVPDETFSVEIVETLGRFFRKGRSPLPDKSQGSTWRETATTSRQRSVFDTAFAALALHRLTRLLDRRIKKRVLSYFPRRAPGELQLKSLFYGDYGSATPEQSVAIVLERMCAHLSNIAPPLPLAPLLLTNTVILFDEFEQVLKNRMGAGDASRSIFHFLTLGMLPKLKNLNEAAKRRHLVYVLLTNELETLDRAAIRPGRFDIPVGVYPPDVLSRAGRRVSRAGGLIPCPNPLDVLVSLPVFILFGRRRGG